MKYLIELNRQKIFFGFFSYFATLSLFLMQIYVRIRNEEWNTYRRYAEFYDFHCKLKKRNPIFSTFDFPPKKAFGKKVSKT